MHEHYYSLHSITSRNAYFNFIVGARGDGKTFANKYRDINKFIKRGEQFIYLRRYETEIKDSKAHYFDDIASFFPDYEFNVNGNNALIRKAGEKEWKTSGYFIQLSNAMTKKSVSYAKVTTITFDEFIISRGYIHYIPDEVRAFLDFYNTVDRWQDRVKVFFLANSVSVVNPYFIYFGITKQKTEFGRYKDGYVCVQFIQDEQFKNEVKQTKFGKLIENTQYSAYAIDNTFEDNTDTFIAKRPPNALFHYGIDYNGYRLGVWLDAENGNYYINRKIPKDQANIFCLTKNDMKPNLIMLEKSSPLLKLLKKIYMQGSLFFSDVETRGVCNEMFAFLNLA